MNGQLSDYFLNGNNILRSPKDSDIEPLVSLINEAYSYQDEAKREPRTNRAHLQKRISETDFYVLEHDENVIGCVYLETKKTVLHFGLLTLAPDYRGKDIARSVMEAIEKYAITYEYKSIDLDYMSLAPWLHDYYEKYGFKETGEVVRWGTIDLIRMSKKIRS